MLFRKLISRNYPQRLEGKVRKPWFLRYHVIFLMGFAVLIVYSPWELWLAEGRGSPAEVQAIKQCVSCGGLNKKNTLNTKFKRLICFLLSWADNSKQCQY